jgi:hypothetical protein
MLVKVMLVLDLDEEEYHVPVDGGVEDEIKEALQEYIYDIDGITIKNIRIVTEEYS